MRSQPNSLRHKALAATALIALLQVNAGMATAEPRPYASMAPSVTNMQVQTQTSQAQVQVLNLAKGRSAVVDLPVDASDVFLSNPQVADAVLRTPRRIFVLGVDGGQSDAIIFDAMGRQILNLSIRVDAPTDELSDTVHRLFPGAQVDVQSLNGHVVLSGMARDDSQADQILRLAQTFVDDPTKVVNLMSIAGKDQVTLKVRIVEINRSTIKQLGLASDVTWNFGTRSYSFGRGNSFGTNGTYLGGKGLCYGQNGSRTTNYDNETTLTNNGSTTTNSGTSSSTSVTNGTSNSVTNTNSLGANFGAGPIPDTITVPDVNGNLVTIPGNTTFAGTSGGLNNSGFSTTTTNSTTSSTDNTSGTTASTAATSVIGSAVTNTISQIYNTAHGMNNTSCLQAFERVGLARTLAEPNLTAVSGESAKFLAGGEFPVPVGQDNQGRITVEFKPFGVGLGFTPVVLSSGKISLKISTEVSELTNVGALQLNSTLNIPALQVRRAETSVEMSSGSSLMIAGLLQSKYKQSIDSLPGLTSLPVLGSLFSSRDFLNDETELVVLVTPYIVDPTDPNQMQTPADNLQIADDASSVFLGRLNKVIKTRDGGDQAAASAAPDAQSYQAPIGYVIE